MSCNSSHNTFCCTHSISLMELQFSSFSILLISLYFVFMLIKFRNKSKASNLPPGPWKLPIIGSIHHLSGSLPHHALRELAKKHGPIMHLKLGEVSTIVVSSPEIAKDVMKTHDINFASRPLILATKIISYDSTSIVFAPYGDYWRQLRKICTLELLSTKRVQSFRSIREEEVANLITLIAANAGSPINLTEKIYSAAYSTTSRAAFGKETKDQKRFILIVKELTKAAAGFNLADLYPSIKLFEWISGMRLKLERLQQETDRIVGNIINEHKEGKEKKNCEGEDLVDVLLKFQDGSDEFQLTTDNIKAVLLDIFSAGSDTSATVVNWAMSEMLKNPSIMKMAQDEVRQVFNSKGNVDEADIHKLQYLKLVIKETLRLHPSAPLLIPRECRQSCEIHGYQIPAKTKVIVNAWAIGRDPKHWTDAECFKPERFLDSLVDYKGANFEYIPFGSGRRICPGMSFGLANVEVPLANFLYHFDWKLPDGLKHEELDMTEALGITVGRKNDLYAIPIPYIPSIGNLTDVTSIRML